MALGCGTHQVEFWNHDFTPCTKTSDPCYKPTTFHEVRWNRVRDDISTAQVTFATDNCCRFLHELQCVRHTMRIFRTKEGVGTPELVWEGIVTRIEWGFTTITVYAQDILWAAYRTVLQPNPPNQTGPNSIVEYDYSGAAVDYAGAQMFDELQATYLNGGSDWWGMTGHVHWVTRFGMITNPGDSSLNVDGGQPRTSKKVPAAGSTVWEDFDKFAEDGGMDYTVINRDVYFWDTHDHWLNLPSTRGAYGVGEEFRPLPQPPTFSLDWVSGVPDIVEYGNEFATRVVRTNGSGLWGDARAVQSVRDVFGPIEILSSDIQENDGNPAPPTDPAAADALRKEFAETAAKDLGNRVSMPTRIRMPSGTQVLPNAQFEINDMIPGAWIWLDMTGLSEEGYPLVCRTLSGYQKLDEVVVSESQEEGETITVSMSTVSDTALVEDQT